MRPDGRLFAAAVTLGVLLAHTLLPVDSRVAGAFTLAASVATLGSARAALLVPLGLGLQRGLAERSASDARRPAGPTRASGRLDVVGVRGRNLVVEAGGLRVLVADSTRALPSPGHSADGTLRIDPVRSRAERSAFDAIAWARSVRIDGRGELLGAPANPRPTPGLHAALERIAHRVRERARRRLGSGSSPGRDLVTALVLGDRTGLEPADLEAFRRAGLAHVLALSGMHVGVLALGLGAMLRAARTPGGPTTVGVLGFLVAFAFVAGSSAPILRASGTGALALIAARLGRRSPPGHGLGLVASVLLLAHPAWLFDAGFRLSFVAAGILGLLAVAPRPSPRGRWRALHGALDGLYVSAVVTLATAPEITGSFGALSVLSPVTNLLAALPATCALGWGALAAFAPLPVAVSDRFAAGAAHAADLLAALALHASHLPGGRLLLPAPSPPLVALVLGGAVALATRRRPPAVIWIPLALLSVTALRPRDRVTILDIGQGDAVFLESRGHAMLFDSGCPGYEGRPADAPPAVTARRVRPLDLLALSHGHADHTGGAGELMEAGRVRSLWMRKPPRDAGLARQAACAQRLGIPVRPPGDPGDPVSIVLGGAVRIASPWDGEPPAETSENDRSLSVRFEAGALAVVLLGDAGHPTEHALLARRDAVREIAAPAPVLLSPHHGSRDSASPELLDAVRPRLVMFSCGSGNPHGHPHAETIARARERGCALLRTDRDGSIALTRTRIGFRIRWTRDFPGPRALLPPIPLPSPGPIS